MPKIVFLNMADDIHVDGHKAVEALRKKHPKKGFLLWKKEQVVEVEMVPFYRAFKANTYDPNDLRRIKNQVNSAEKVMLSIHGPMKHVGHASIRPPLGTNQPSEQVTDLDLGNLLLALFDRGTSYNLTLVTCFAARSSAYEQDHTQTHTIDWTDSYAYKVFDTICPGREVRMTARTGELEFNTITGKSEVQTELSIQGVIEGEQIRAEQAVARAQTWWDTNLVRLSHSAIHGQFVIDLITANKKNNHADKLYHLRALRENHGLPRLNADTQQALTYLYHHIRLIEASIRQTDLVQGKHGKLVYRYIHGVGICIFAKYPSPEMVHPRPASLPFVVDAANMVRPFT